MHKYISIDIETTGLDHNNHQIIEFAAVLPNGSHFTKFVVHPEYRGSAIAIAMNKRIFDALSKFQTEKLQAGPGTPYVHAAELYYEFRHWLEANGIIEQAHPIGKNYSGFDAQFLRTLNCEFPTLFHYRALDIGSMYATDSGVPGLKELVDKWPEVVQHIPGELHDALYDARVCMAFAKHNVGGL